MTKIAFLAGTSGLVGMQLLHQLIINPDYEYILSFGRRKLALKHSKLIQIPTDFKNMNALVLEEKLRESDLGGDNFQLIQKLEKASHEIDCFCSLGTTIKVAGSKQKFYEIDHDFVVNFAQWAKNNGASQMFYVSASGADAKSSIFYSKVKGQVENSLKALGFQHLAIFRPSLLLGNRLEFRFGEEIGKILTKPLVWLKLFKKIRPVHDYQVAKAMVNYAQNMSENYTIVPSEIIQNY